MPVPVVADLTQRLYDALPGLYRAADAAQPAGGNERPLLRFLSLLGDQADEVAVLFDRLALHDDGTGDWISELSDPELADPAWLDWLAYLAGVRVTDAMPVAAKRAAIAGAPRFPATVPALKAAVAAVLGGTQRVEVVEQWGGDPWRIVVWTYAPEVADPSAVDAAIATQKPAGMIVQQPTVQPGLTWYDAARQFASWGAMAAGAATWAQRSTQVPTW